MPEEDRSKETEPVEYRGLLHLYAATGTEGSFLAFYDQEPDPNRPGKYGWDRFHYVRDGDGLVIYDKEDPEKVVWEGQVALKDPSGIRLDQYGDFWKSASQEGATLSEWTNWFVNWYPAKLTTREIKKP